MAFTKTQVRVFLKKHNFKVDELSRMAGICRWSLRRFLKNERADLTLRIANRLEEAMRVYEKNT